ncbi:MAG: DUF4446 family protein [Butyrivibrio sp.]|nr:DUF4446 family protein [Butyrivibrio sp.]
MLNVFGLFEIDTLYVVLGLILVIIVLLILLIVSMRKIKKTNMRLSEFMKGKNAESLEDLVTSKFKEIEDLKVSNKVHAKRLKNLEEAMLKVYSKTGIIKYDAFNEMGGKLSFALALLDNTNNGFIINAIHSHEGCYTYIKEIVNGESYITLGEEEKKALANAINQDEVTEN